MSEDAASLQDDDFALFGVPRRFRLDRAALDARWKQLQRLAHPDRFAHQGAAAQRIAMQWSVRINEAYQRLRDPLRRAAYWCELQGVPIEAESNTAMPADFLLQQMQWREALDEARTPEDVEALLQAVEAERRERLDALADAIDVRADPQAAVAQVRALMFIERFADTLHARLDG
ncbi:Fe-S protein assembly co-chaperone HscB [Tepidimonas fonticaldi]|uniref:Co-chaperone protein HscB homolog n=1 Tax=Tepidimonas fonticaldi TaxID=1101373 RepID=A0A1A6DVY6_9BURK|nr:Fe-S protein assembly co-chaperone HscB [Tepidimonas fonticaldi]